ncbi:TRAP transporter substrate-binding protein [Shumkonia mesophila]|uniref:TRAP transporter substrate-binding protein n=1 Tax=Shumkonia mesophila TaxID=2838854 RepID=UPI002934EC1C|nr:TRAP transporter substrate-binding protein [Shumkonia mesophila]
MFGRQNRLTVLFSALALVLASNSAQAQKKETLAFAHGFAPAQSWAKAAVKFKEIVEKETNGNLTIKLFDSGILGEQRQLIEQIIDAGTNDLTISLEPLSAWVPDINVYQMLYLFRDMNHLIKFEEGAVGKDLKEITKKKTGLRVLTYFPRPARELSTTKTVVNSINDVKGLKLRVTPSKAAIAGWTAIGAKTVPMNWGEVFTALRQGVLDAQENPFDHMLARKTYEVTKYAARTDHVFASVYVLMSEKKYKSLPEEWQRVIDKAAVEVHDYERAIVIKEDAEAVAKLEGLGMKITSPDLEPFRAAAKQSYDDFPDLKPWIEKIQAIK